MNEPRPYDELDIIRIEHPIIEICRMYVKNKAAVISLAAIIVIVIAAFAGPTFYSIDPFDIVSGPMAFIFE